MTEVPVWTGAQPDDPRSPWFGDAPPTRTDWAEELLRFEILTGGLRPGEWLKISGLVGRYPGLSPTPTREALSRLAGSGLVEFLPRRGARVAGVSADELQDIYRNRRSLEATAVGLSLERADAAWDDELAAAFAALEEISEQAGGDAELGRLEPGELVAWERCHRRFHFALVARCGSPWMIRLIEILYDNSMRYRYLTLGSDRGQSFSTALAMHRPLLEAARARDRDATLAELHAHTALTLSSLDEMELP